MIRHFNKYCLAMNGTMPVSYIVGQDLNWDAPWIDVTVWVELPFWLMVNNATFTTEVEGHKFSIATKDNYFELYWHSITDSRCTSIYIGPQRKREALSDGIQSILKSNPGVPFMWRKCKTVLKIKSRCNEDVWNAANVGSGSKNNTAGLYLSEFCNAHIPVVNRLVQVYRPVEAQVRRVVEATEGSEQAEKFLKRTRNKFNERVVKYEEITKSKMSEQARKHLFATRKLRNQIVHDGYRINPSERGLAHRYVDTGRWLFNWLENDSKRMKVRESRIGFRSLGLDRSYGVFPSHISSEGMVVLPTPSLQRISR
jgi:hypothetical protein